MASEQIYIYGRHAIAEAIQNTPHAVKKIFFTPQFDGAEIRKIANTQNIPVEALNLGALPQGIDETAAHQGVSAIISLASIMRPYKEFARGITITNDTMLVLLGEVEDPQNVGAVIRSAAAFGAAGVLIPEHNQAQITGAVVKVSAGMAFRIPLVTIGNVNTTIRDLKDRGFWIYGLEGEAETALADEGFDAPTVLVLGNESKGIRQKTRELCDILLSISTNPKCESLNAAASAAVALYAWSAKHPNAVR
ncbi:MAG: 23S rRNA (guanosine(2251)-2'-O)-methyltransferase RlmB [Candidatus Yonathbacteria bacterium]|nr:23S rRNA (guanosine(2251)-2'-O)-methyltransferase RlmB [Candidatus Yonathbacteria bacterium]